MKPVCCCTQRLDERQTYYRHQQQLLHEHSPKPAMDRTKKTQVYAVRKTVTFATPLVIYISSPSPSSYPSTAHANNGIVADLDAVTSVATPQHPIARPSRNAAVSSSRTAAHGALHNSARARGGGDDDDDIVAPDLVILEHCPWVDPNNDASSFLNQVVVRRLHSPTSSHMAPPPL